MLLAFPLMLANIATPLVGVVDQMVAGRLGDIAAIGGIAFGTAIFNALYWCFGFLRMSTSGFVAQAVGARNDQEIVLSAGRALFVAIAVGVLVIIFQAPIRQAFLWFLGGSDGVQKAAATYYNWRIWAAPAGFASFALLGAFIGLGQTVIALKMQLILNVANMLLAYLFGIALGWGIEGVGFAVFLSEWIAVAYAVYALNRVLLIDRSAITLANLLEPAAVARFFNANSDILIRTACVLAAAQIFLKLGATGGDAQLAANALLGALLFVIYFLLDGYANAAETLVGQTVGARDPLALKTAVVSASIAAGITGAATSLIFWLFGPSLLALMTPDPLVLATAHSYLPWAILLPMVTVWCFLLDGVFIGATRTRDMRNMMLLSFVAYLAALAVLYPIFGNHGLWAAHCVFFAVRGLTLWWRYPALVAAVSPAHSPSLVAKL
jgi:multidrug resistance protein, MATE family